MYGPGAAPPSRSAATVITLRVLFAAAGFLSCGVLACIPLFRVAIVRGRWFNWVAAWVSLPLSLACFMLVGTLPEGDYRVDLALAGVLLLGLASSAYFLTVDIRLSHQPRQFGGYAAPHAPAAQTPYGYPQPASPYAATPVPQSPQPPHPSTPHTPIPQPPMPQAPAPRPHAPHNAASPGLTPPPPPPPPRPGPARIDQVRAELDELSDYLRRQEGRQDGAHEGGR